MPLLTPERKIGVRITINGRDFIEMVREVELPFATREGYPTNAGAYTYFGPFTLSPCRHFLGEAVHSWSDGPGRIYLLSCTCGTPECWPLSARVEVRKHEIIWSDFRQPHRGPESPPGQWRYEGFGPFVFDRRSYEQALAIEPAPRKPRPRTEKTRLTEIFNLGFRRGANDRAAAGIKPTKETSIPPAPPPPPEHDNDCDRKAWAEGHRTGYKIGASDAELASVDIPGAHGMISGFDEKFMEQFGLFKGLSEHTTPDEPSVANPFNAMPRRLTKLAM